MRISNYLLALAALALTGCVVYEPAPVTTTTVTREVTTTGPVTAPVTREVVITEAPPTLRVETQTVSPGPSYVWTKGHWGRVAGRYQWVPGTWVARPRVGAVWVDGHWLRRGGGWVWVAGRWR